MMEKVYKITYWVFLVISISVFFSLFSGIVDYGFGWDGLLVQCMACLFGVLMTVIRLIFRKVDRDWKEVLVFFLVLLMSGLCIYYVIGIH